MRKRKTRTNEGKKYDKPISAYPLKPEELIKAIFEVKIDGLSKV